MYIYIMWLDLQKPFQITHLVTQELAIWRTEPTWLFSACARFTIYVTSVYSYVSVI